MTFVQATARLAALSYSGLTTSYDMIELPGVVNEVDLPALLVLPSDGGIQVQPYDANLSFGEVHVFIDHLLLVQGHGQGRVEDRNTSLASWVSTYVDTISTDWYLNDNLLYPMAVRQGQFGLVEYGGVLYVGIEFNHRWSLKV